MVNYNGQAHLEEGFESVFNLNYPRDKYEVVVVDNASSDGSPEWIRQNYPEVRLVRLDKNTGFARGNNIGVNCCQGKFITLANNDTVMDKDWLVELVKQALKDPQAIYCGKTLSYSKRDYIIFGGVCFLPGGIRVILRRISGMTIRRYNPLSYCFQMVAGHS